MRGCVCLQKLESYAAESTFSPVQQTIRSVDRVCPRSVLTSMFLLVTLSCSCDRLSTLSPLHTQTSVCKGVCVTGVCKGVCVTGVCKGVCVTGVCKGVCVTGQCVTGQCVKVCVCVTGVCKGVCVKVCVYRECVKVCVYRSV